MGIRSVLIGLLAVLGLQNLPAELPETQTEDGGLPLSPVYAPAEEPVLSGLRKRVRSSESADLSCPEYYDYDPALFYELCDGLEELARQGEEEAVVEQYDRLYEEFLLVDTLSTVAYLDYCADVFDPEAAENRQYSDEVWSETADALICACRRVLEGPCAGALEEHVGPDAAAYYRSYEGMSSREQGLFDRESRLVDEYYEQLALEDSLVCVYGGRDWTMSLLNGPAGDTLYEKDYDGYFEVYYDLLEQLNRRVGPIFLELVQLRDEIADYYGFESYADYAYAALYGRDYTTDDAQAFCDAVKESVSQDYYDEVYYDDRSLFGPYRGEAMDARQLLEALGAQGAAMDPLVEECWQLLTENELYDIDSGPRRMDSAFNLTLSHSNAPFIYMNMSGDTYDFVTLSHEFGHFVDAWVNPVPNLLVDVGDFDLFEVHSNGLQVLYMPFYESVYGPSAEDVSFAVLGDMLDSVVAGCLYDEFQRRVYAEPDMSLREVNALYAELCREYGEYNDLDEDHYWIYIGHNYDSPLYYISYAASALAALQIWQESQVDYAAGVALWRQLVEAGAFEKSYTEVLAEAGMKSFADEGAVEEICRPVLMYLRELD